MDDKVINISSDDKQNKVFSRLMLLVEMFGHWTDCPTNQNLIKYLKFLSQWIRKRHYKTLVTNLIYSSISPSSLVNTENVSTLFFQKFFESVISVNGIVKSKAYRVD